MTPDDEALLERLPPEARGANGVPSPEDVLAGERAVGLAEGALAEVLREGGLRVSPLGAGWSRDIDAHVSGSPDPDDLVGRGWRSLDRLLVRLGYPGRGRWAVVEDGQVLAPVDLDPAPPPDPLEAVLRRCRRRREVRAREVLELRSLARGGRRLPRDRVLAAAAAAEAWLGGDVLADHRRTSPRPPPVPLRGAGGWVRALPRPRRRVVVAVAGIDGAGKSTLCRTLGRHLTRAGVPNAVVWTRPGMRLRMLDRLARAVKRARGEGDGTGLRQVAEGRPPGSMASRRGILGWGWSLLVTLSFVRDVRRRYRRSRGVVIFDRHLLDALVTLEFAYPGVPLGAHRALVRRALPRADLGVYLDLPAEMGARRKPDPLFGLEALRRQSDLYHRWLPSLAEIRRIEATRPPSEVAMEVFDLLLREG